jgi:DnaJ-class molecular chaperone
MSNRAKAFLGLLILIGAYVVGGFWQFRQRQRFEFGWPVAWVPSSSAKAATPVPACARCGGDGYVGGDDIARLGMSQIWRSGPCGMCNPAQAAQQPSRLATSAPSPKARLTWVTCTNCGGNGLEPLATTCRTCNGTGDDYKGAKYRCSACAGRGVRADGTGGVEQCPRCQGSGEVFLVSEHCHVCKGSGLAHDQCFKCNGSGRILTQVNSR